MEEVKNNLQTGTNTQESTKKANHMDTGPIIGQMEILTKEILLMDLDQARDACITRTGFYTRDLLRKIRNKEREDKNMQMERILRENSEMGKG